MKFNKNDSITMANGSRLSIIDFLGDGGQGDVYLVNDGKKDYALKIYKEAVDDDFKYNLKNNISKGSPSSRFLWPKEMVSFDDNSLGYIMDVRPNNYKSFISYLNGKTQFKNQSTMITWAIELCSSFKKLHEMGYSYQDLNDGSFFLDPDTGSILICDNDNVTVAQKNLGVLGKMKYMAPEIVTGKAMPDVHSDRFSLAVILFYTFLLGNPYEGECLKNYDFVDEDAEYEIYGSKPVYVFHDTDLSNRPIRGYHTAVLKRWNYIPSYVKEAFHRTFVDGLNDRENGRVTEIEWIKLLTKYRDELITCSCGHQYPYGIVDDKDFSKCPYCGGKKDKKYELYMNKNHIVLEPGKNVYENHLDKYSSDYLTSVATVIAAKSDPSKWGIRINIAGGVEIKDTYGNVKYVECGGVIPIVYNLKIRFKDGAIAEIREL